MGTDYSEFEYQQITAQIEIEDPVTNPNASVLHTLEPLRDIGGLDNNEVAELVYLETQASVEIEDEVADQDVGTAMETRGTVGLNLAATRASLVGGNIGSGDTDGATDIIETFNGVDPANVESANSTRSEDRILQLYRANGGIPFDDQLNGPGGNASFEHFYAEKHYRNMTGRGPVLDANDDVSITQALNAGDTVVPVGANVRCHLIWDVAEVNDAGRAFSVPE